MLRVMGLFSRRRQPARLREPRAYFAATFAADPFTAAGVAMAPTQPGVYLLYRSGRLIYIGMAASGSGIRAALEAHRRGAYGRCTRSATAFDYELSADPPETLHAYLRAHMARYGRLPPCNEDR
jgi:hypothetical protein